MLTQKASPGLALSVPGLGSDAIESRQADGLSASCALGTGWFPDALLYSSTWKVQFVQSELVTPKLSPLVSFASTLGLSTLTSSPKPQPPLLDMVATVSFLLL